MYSEERRGEGGAVGDGDKVCVCACVEGVVIHINSQIARRQHHRHNAMAAILQTELNKETVQLFYLPKKKKKKKRASDGIAITIRRNRN